MNVQWDAKMSVQEMIDEGVRRAYNHPDNKLRASVLLDPAGKRQNSKDNTPAVVHCEVVPGDDGRGHLRGQGRRLREQDQDGRCSTLRLDRRLGAQTVPTMGAGWCPPGILGIGIGGTPEKAMLLAKESLMDPVTSTSCAKAAPPGAHALPRRGTAPRAHGEGQRARHRRPGPGRLTTVLDVKIMDYPTTPPRCRSR